MNKEKNLLGLLRDIRKESRNNVLISNKPITNITKLNR